MIMWFYECHQFCLCKSSTCPRHCLVHPCRLSKEGIQWEMSCLGMNFMWRGTSDTADKGGMRTQQTSMEAAGGWAAEQTHSHQAVPGPWGSFAQTWKLLQVLPVGTFPDTISLWMSFSAGIEPKCAEGPFPWAAPPHRQYIFTAVD